MARDLYNGAISSSDEIASAKGATLIGTAPEEYITDPNAVRKVLDELVRVYREMGMQYVPGDALAYAEGDIGWVIDQPTFRTADGKEAPARATTIFRREGDVWKMVHQHVSLAVPNDQVEAFRQ